MAGVGPFNTERFRYRLVAILCHWGDAELARLIALLSCPKSKTSYPAPARELYSASPRFRKALAYMLPYADDVYVLSARYGLVTLDEPLEPYEQTLKTTSTAARRAWAGRVLDQIAGTAEISPASPSSSTPTSSTGNTWRCYLPGQGPPARARWRGCRWGSGSASPEEGGWHRRSAQQRTRRRWPGAGSNSVWAGIAAHAGEPFSQIRRGESCYRSQAARC